MGYFPLSWDVLIRFYNAVTVKKGENSYFPLSWDVLIRLTYEVHTRRIKRYFPLSWDVLIRSG